MTRQRAVLPFLVLLPTWAGWSASTPRHERHHGSTETSPDTVRVSRAVLGRALANPRPCSAAGSAAGIWTRPPTMTDAGRATIGADGTVALIDRASTAVRLFAAEDGREVARLGRRGAGPGEFGASMALYAWPGDTIGVHDFYAARILLFTSGGFQTTLRMAELPMLVTSGLLGRFTDGSLLFAGGFDPSQSLNRPPIFRATMRLVRWRPGAESLDTLDASFAGPEHRPGMFGGRPGVISVNLARRTWAGTIGREVAIYDNARPLIQITSRTGSVDLVVALDVDDPPVSTADRDSVNERIEFELRRSNPPPDVAVTLKLFPKTRAAALWQGTDQGEGFWLSFHPPVAAGNAVYIRFSSAGVPTRCFRGTAGMRAVAFSPDRVVTLVESAEGDIVNVARTIPYPAQ